MFTFFLILKWDSNIVIGNINIGKEKKHSHSTCLWLAPRPWDMESKIGGDNRLQHMNVNGFEKMLRNILKEFFIYNIVLNVS